MKYSAKFKLQVVKFVQESNNRAAGREFCVNEKLVCDWRKQVEKLKCMPKNKCSNRRKRQSGYIVTRNMIIIKAKAMAAELQILVTGFLASNCWCTKFLQWKNLALRQKTKIAQKLPEDHKLPQLRHQKQKEGKLRTCSHGEHGRNACLV